jgi:hypothetical protein
MVDSVARRANVLVALGLAASTACGGLSQRQVGDNESGAGGDGASGGNATGGRGGTGGVGADYTGGVGGSVGGSVYTGGVGAVGGSMYTGGSGGVGGSVYTGGVGGVGAGYTGGVGGNVPTAGAPSYPFGSIPWESDGYISANRNIAGLEGGFYFATDCTSAAERNLPCTEGDPGLSGPDGQYGWALSETVACARGKAVHVVADPATGVPAYELQWGALLGIAMYEPGDSVYDATARRVIGFAFDLSGVAPPELRVNVVTPETIGASHFVTAPVTPFSQQTLFFADAWQGSWIANPSALDTTRVSAIEFHVSTNTSGPTAFDFCISNLRVIFP